MSALSALRLYNGGDEPVCNLMDAVDEDDGEEAT
jgi:hypothetical protein